MNVACSVVIPCYNQAHFAAEALSSLQAQTFGDWEAIVVDDASTLGDVASVVHELGDSRAQVIRHPVNRGLGAARNTGFRAARADLVLPLDADDALTPTFLEETVTVLHRQPNADCVYADLQLFGGSDGRWHYDVRTPEAMLERQWIPGPGTLMRKAVWSRVGGYLETRSQGNEDWDFWIAAVQQDLVPVHIPKPLYRYRRSPASMSVSTMLQTEYLSREEIYQRHRRFFDEYGAGGRFRAEGYCRSSGAALGKGERLRALRLALRGLALAPGHQRLHRQLARTVLPSPVPTWIRAVRDWRGTHA